MFTEETTKALQEFWGVERFSRKQSKSPELFDDEGKARWITIGGEVGADGKKHGGHPVKIGKDGEIQAGMGGKFNGKKIDEAFGKKEPKKELTSKESDDTVIASPADRAGADSSQPESSDSQTSKRETKMSEHKVFQQWDELQETSLPFAEWPKPLRGGVKRKLAIDPRVKRAKAILSPTGESIVETGETFSPGDVVLAISPASSSAVQFVMAHRVTKVYDRSQYGKPGTKVFTTLLVKTPVAALYDSDHKLGDVINE